MRYSTEPREKKYVKRYGFLSFAKNFGDEYCKKNNGYCSKTRIDAVKTVSKRVA